MSIWIIVAVILLLVFLGLMPTLIRRKRLEINLGIIVFFLLLIFLIYIVVAKLFPINY